MRPSWDELRENRRKLGAESEPDDTAIFEEEEREKERLRRQLLHARDRYFDLQADIDDLRGEQRKVVDRIQELQDRLGMS